MEGRGRSEGRVKEVRYRIKMEDERRLGDKSKEVKIYMDGWMNGWRQGRREGKTTSMKHGRRDARKERRKRKLSN